MDLAIRLNDDDENRAVRVRIEAIKRGLSVYNLRRAQNQGDSESESYSLHNHFPNEQLLQRLFQIIRDVKRLFVRFLSKSGSLGRVRAHF